MDAIKITERNITQRTKRKSVQYNNDNENVSVNIIACWLLFTSNNDYGSTCTKYVKLAGYQNGKETDGGRRVSVCLLRCNTDLCLSCRSSVGLGFGSRYDRERLPCCRRGNLKAANTIWSAKHVVDDERHRMRILQLLGNYCSWRDYVITLSRVWGSCWASDRNFNLFIMLQAIIY